jgi:adenosylmethionine-8-amino-7-oxononanoate aminotransferase
MNREEKLKQQVTEVAKNFFAGHTSLKRESIVADIHSDGLVIALEKEDSAKKT